MLKRGNMKSLKYVMSILAIGLLSVYLLSCGGSSGGDDDSGGSGGGGGQSLTVTGASGNQISLNGTWKSGCNYDAGDEESEIWTITVSGASFTQTNNIWFESMTCPGTSDVTIAMSGTVTLGDEVTVAMNGSNVTATKVDPNISSYEGTINNADLVADFNADRICGFDNWVVNTPKNLIGTSCGPDSEIKDVIYIDDTVDPNVWYNGDDEAPVDANDYPTEIDSDSAMEKT